MLLGLKICHLPWKAYVFFNSNLLFHWHPLLLFSAILVHLLSCWPCYVNAFNHEVFFRFFCLRLHWTHFSFLFIPGKRVKISPMGCKKQSLINKHFNPYQLHVWFIKQPNWLYIHFNGSFLLSNTQFAFTSFLNVCTLTEYCNFKYVQ